MRYFDETLITESRPHQAWWGELCANREFFHQSEEAFGDFLVRQGVVNAAAILPRDAWIEFDNITTRILRDDGGDPYMRDLMALAKPVNIGKLVHMTRVASDSNAPVVRSMSGQVPVAMDKVVYDYRGTPVPIFADGFGREWREWNTLQSENFDALADDQEASVDKLNRDMADYVLNGDATVVFQGYTGYGIRTNPLTKLINLGSAGGGANIDLTSATPDALDNFFTQTFGAMLDANLIIEGVNLYISKEIARAWDRQYSTAEAFKAGTVREFISKNRRIKKIEVTTSLVGNQFFGFVPSARFIRPIVGMAVNTTARTRPNPTDNYQFLNMGAMGLEQRADYNGKAGVFASTDID
jgi:hypothetical protein